MNEKDIHASFDLALAGLRKGEPIERYEKLIKKYQEKERFEDCAGVKKAIERWVEFKK